jgi:hypothetical protein
MGKVIRVIKSCKNLTQLSFAKKYMDLYLISYYNESFKLSADLYKNQCNLLYQTYVEKEKELKNIAL